MYNDIITFALYLMHGTFMVSYDVYSLFTVILLSETIDIAVKLILENKKDTKFSENQLTKLFRFVRHEHNFTTEKRHMKQFSFLDVLSTRSDRLITSVYKKSKFTKL